MEYLSRPICIETKRCTLREMRVQDAAYWFAFMNDPVIMRFLHERIVSLQEMNGIVSWLVDNYSRNTADIVRITLGIYRRSDELHPIGWVTCGPLPEDSSEKELGYALEPGQWGQGLAAEASREFLEWLKNSIGIQKIYATVDVRNSASIRVLEKLAMKECVETESGHTRAMRGHRLYVRDL